MRNGAKIMSVRANAGFVREVAKEHGSFGKLAGQVAVLQRGRVARTARETRQPARRQHRPDAAALPRLGRLRDVERHRRLPARRRPRRRRGPSTRSATSPRCRRSSTPGPRKPACPTRTYRASAPCRSARITMPIRWRVTSMGRSEARVRLAVTRFSIKSRRTRGLRRAGAVRPGHIPSRDRPASRRRDIGALVGTAVAVRRVGLWQNRRRPRLQARRS